MSPVPGSSKTEPGSSKIEPDPESEEEEEKPVIQAKSKSPSPSPSPSGPLPSKVPKKQEKATKNETKIKKTPNKYAILSFVSLEQN